MKDNIIVTRICNHIKAQIMSKEMFPGYRIIEDELASRLGVSRTPLRRAFAQLQYEGFLDIIPNRGTFVIKPTYDEIRRVYEARACLEEGLAASAVNHVTEEDIEDLEENYRKQVAMLDSFNIVDYSALNRDFHMRLAAISNNEYLKKYVEEIHNRIFVFLVYYDNSVNNAGSSVTHKTIIDALKNRDYESLIEGIRADASLGSEDIFRSRTDFLLDDATL
ncbi:MAG TPA: GntR family transcriptional regulator [Bacillota bacterium]|nr:GntR family transcriptional regulator [Bacillota bacterium]